MEDDKPIPTPTDVLAFFIWHKLGSVPIGEYEHATQVRRWILEYHSKSMIEWHEYFYDHYQEYVELFSERLELV